MLTEERLRWAQPKRPIWYGAKPPPCAIKIRSRESSSSAPLPNAGHSRGFRKSLVAQECVVADAVAVEPVSAAKFLVNREKNRDFFDSETVSDDMSPLSPIISGL